MSTGGLSPPFVTEKIPGERGYAELSSQNSSASSPSSAPRSSSASAPSSRYSCPQCGQGFRLQSALDAHIVANHAIVNRTFTSDPKAGEAGGGMVEGGIGGDGVAKHPFQPDGVEPIPPADPFADDA